MSQTLRQFANSMLDRANTIDERGSDAACQVAIAIITDLVIETPVDSSKALSNWVVGIGAPNRSVLEPYSYGHLGSTQEISAADAIAAARAVLATKQPGQPIFISNNLPYIRRLNEGSSSQAPAGFVERSALIGSRQAKVIKV